MNAALFDPALMPARDSDGWAFHPNLDQFLVDAEGNLLSENDLENDSENVYYSHTRINAAGFDVTVIDFYDDADQAVREAYEDGAPDIGEWKPTSPEGDGWRLVAISDTEDGPKAMYVRPMQ